MPDSHTGVREAAQLNPTARRLEAEKTITKQQWAYKTVGIFSQ